MSNRRKSNNPGPVIGFKIESHRPEDDPSFTAGQLADAIQTEVNASRDAIEYRASAQRERQKAKLLIGTLTMLQEYNRQRKEKIKNDPDWESKKPWEGGASRMEPMESYDEDDLKAQKIKHIGSAKELDERANEFDQIVKEMQALQSELQRKLKNKG